MNHSRKHKLISLTAAILTMTAVLLTAGCGQSDNAETAGAEKTCVLSVSCETVLSNMENLKEGKEEIIPSDGFIIPEATVAFSDGETAYDVLERETKKNKIHMESEYTPAYDSTYIEGIGNLYAGDCGDLSGWLYTVNGEMPAVSASQYALQEGDAVAFVYTCDGGNDITD